MCSDSLRPRLVQFSPPSTDLYTPSPIETLLRVHASPVPTHTTFGFLGSMVIAPIDWTGCLSNTGLNVVPPFTDFHTPPLAAPMYTVSRSPSFTASSAATRPLIAAEPMLRAPKPEIVSESTFTAACCGACKRNVPAVSDGFLAWTFLGSAGLAGAGAAAFAAAAGCWKRWSSIATLASIFSNVTFCLLSLPLTLLSIENGRYQPATSL